MLKVSFNPLTVMKGLQELSKTKESGNIGDKIEDVLKKEDSIVDNIVASKDAIAQPENRVVMKESIEILKSELKEILGGLTDEGVPKTVGKLHDMAVQGIVAGMLVGNVKVALALIPEAQPMTETPASVKAPSLKIVGTRNNSIEDQIDDSFLTADMIAGLAAEKREELTKPSYRQETIDELNSMKEQTKKNLSSVTEETLPKTISEALDIFIAAFTFGTLAGVTKTALALIPVKSIEPKPDTGLPGDGGGPAICPKPAVPEPVVCPK